MWIVTALAQIWNALGIRTNSHHILGSVFGRPLWDCRCTRSHSSDLDSTLCAFLTFLSRLWLSSYSRQRRSRSTDVPCFVFLLMLFQRPYTWVVSFLWQSIQQSTLFLSVWPLYIQWLLRKC